MSNGEHYRTMRAAYLALVDLGVVEGRRPRGWKKGVPRTSNPEERKETRRLKNIDRKRAQRRASGIMPRDNRGSINSTRPWVVEGISQRTWYRRKRKLKQEIYQ